MSTPLEKLAANLLRDGYVDNEPDARLAALRILVANEELVSQSEGNDQQSQTETA